MILSENEIHRILQLEYDRMTKEYKIGTYRINDCGPPWIGALLSHIVHCSNFLSQNGFILNMSKNDHWKMTPNGSFLDVFNSLKLTDDTNFSINNFSSSNTRISYNINRNSLNHSFTEKVGYFYPKILEDIFEINDKIILSDIWKSFLLKQIFVLTEQYQFKVEQKLSKFKELKSYSAIHIRRGDKVKGPLKESNLIQVDRYFKCLESVKNNNKVFISTDSNDALEECIRMYGNTYELVYDKDEIRNDGFPLKIINNSLNINDTAEEELLTALKNFTILKNSEILIGTPASWFFRISMLLRPYNSIKDVKYAERTTEIPNYPAQYFHC